MYPEIFHLPFLHTYGVLVALAFLAGLWMAARLARRAHLNPDAVMNLGMYCAIAAIAGAKLMMFLVDIPYYTEHPGEIFSLSTLQAGGVFYGGLIAALAVAAADPAMRRGCQKTAGVPGTSPRGDDRSSGK